ncbi:hypothetical protein OPS25_04645 [Alteromonas ponticola]|uniref:Uncharacterized protein n=1 Tax=Alteromonas aquimaris TaxID=2998417 RepID=A0ABT3P4U3_9ALTE|nr:hypothetical protein [Alteromonas aquimaris]MCW8107786.1 hypothetical protein [Alteromonas aquimaris]
MIALLLIPILSSLFFYVEAFKSGMKAKAWAIAGFFVGPFLIPLFTISRHVAERKATGFNNLYLRA